MFLGGFESEFPQFCRSQRESFEWLAAAHARAAVTASEHTENLEQWQRRIARLLKRYSCSPENIGHRFSEIADFMHTDWPRMTIFNLHENPRGSGLSVRNAFYARTATRVVEKLFAGCEHPPSNLIHVSCTGYVSPSAVQRLIELKKWNSRTQAAQVYHMGCYAALPAVRIAAALLVNGANKRSRTDIVHTELCTLHFNPNNHSPEQLIVQTLFADGHIRYSIAPDETGAHQRNGGAFEILAMNEAMVPESLDDMTWVLSDSGFQMTLSRDVPEKIASSLGMFLSTLFGDAGLNYSKESRDAVFAIHPGGPRILDSLAELLRLEPRQLQLSRAVLWERGNMSSATLPHIWMAAAADGSVKQGTLVVSLGFGPGLTMAGAVFRKC